MYSTCLFCTRPLGTNETIEHFPVGRRLAFDAARGRLWVVCPHCRRWNLTPLEERWEAVEEAERLFRDTRLRVSTGEIGLARLSSGMELVRVGRPQRPEIASWRYGEQFSRRRRNQILLGVAVTAGVGVVAAGGLAAGVGVFSSLQLAQGLWRLAERGSQSSKIAVLRLEDGQMVSIRRRDLGESSLYRGLGGGLAFRLRHAGGVAVVEGDGARQIATRIFAGINRRGGTPEDVELALKRLDHARSAETFLAETARRGERLTPVVDRGKTFDDRMETLHLQDGSGLLALSTSFGLAVEMALHEEQERRALEGELAELEAAWREAEEIGAIADSLLLPEGIERALARLKR